MPIRVANTIVKRLSKQLYYNYGKAVASRTHLLLLFSFTFISYFSLPAITKYYHEIITPTIYNNIPLSHLSTSLDAQCWHASAHVQFSNFSTSRHPPSEYLITEQIRLSHPDQPVTFDLIEHARQIYESISTTIITVDEDPSPVSLASICYKHHSHCLVHAPPFVQFRDADEWRTKTVLDHTHTQTQYETHPYSVYSNATFDHQGRFLKADAVLLTFVLRQNKNGNAIRIWNKLLQEVKSKYNIVDFETQPTDASHSIWAAPSNTVAHTIQYKFDLFPYDISYKVQVSILAYIIIFYLVSMTFGKSNLVKSSYSFGLAAVFLSIACFTTTWGIVDRLGITLNHVPWYLLLVVVNIGCLENIFLLTNAVLYAGCDMEVIEKISRGLQSVGVPMTATLIAELFILNVGKHMDTLLIQEFCIFAQLALIVDFILQATFVVAVLSIDIKRVELTDLDDRQTSKRLHELANYEFDKKQAHHADFCPIQDTHNKQNSKSCAECKEFKTHRVLNAFMLHLSSSTSLTSTVDSLSVASDPFIYQPNLNQLSNQFWSTVNPEKDVTWLHIQPVQLFVYSSDRERVQEHIDYLQHLYQVKTTDVQYNPEYRPSLFRIFILSIMKGTFKLLSSINIPVLILCLVMIGIITWMTPKWRKEWLVPLMIQCFNQSMLALIQWFRILMQFSKRIYHAYSKKQPFGSSNKEYDANGLHRGAITAQSLFNQQQYKANVKQVHVRTLTHQHAADIQDLDFNAKHSLVSCDQDGRIVLWHADNTNPTWMARLDRLHPIRGGLLQATLNPDYYAKKKSSHHHGKHQRKQKSSRSLALSSHLSKARCVKIDQGNKWVAAGFDDGLIRVWNANTGTLVREMDIHPSIPLVEIQQEPTSANLRRRLNGNESPTLSYSSVTSSLESKKADRVLSLEYVGAIAEFCHPSIAEAAARCGSSEIEVSQNFIVSVHKSGLLHEWNILSGECIQTIKTGHTKDITQLHIVDSKAPYRKQGITWVFTASKDGTVKCWERRLIQKKQTAEEDHPPAGYPSEDEAETQQTRWSLIYTLKQDSPVTSIATELPVGGMGVLVTGCANASVKVWNFETGELICTLSSGKTALSSASSVVSATSSLPRDAINIGGPIRRFSRFSNHMAANATSNLSSDEEDASDSSCSSVSYRSSLQSASDHKGSIQQVVVTRYCEVENGPGLCRGCDTCFGSGFLVASSCTDNKVHAWRLERSDSGYEGPCALCIKDYHRKQYKHRKTSTNSSDDGSVEGLARKSAAAVGRNRKRVHHSASPMVKKKQVSGRPLMDAFNNQESMDSFELLDIEQLAGDVNISLQSTFLGKIDQVAGQALVFCDNILAGVRRRRHHHHTETNKLPKSEWEVWFASLQYYDPSLHKDDDAEESNHMRIPIEVFDLEDDVQTTLPHSKRDKKEEEHYKAIQVLKGTLLNLFTSSSSPSSSPLGHQEPMQRDHTLKYKRIHAYSSESSDEDTRKDQEEDLTLEEENLDAGENLPFSTVRRIVSLDGSGLACDFGNFIKLIYLDRPSLTDKERSKQLRQTIEDFGVSHQHIIDEAVVEENEEADGASYGEGNACSMENRGKDGCCGGTNKDKNSGKCCGGMTKQKQQERRQQRVLKKKPQVAATCGGGANGIIECSLKNSCSRASECASNSQSIATNASIPSFSNWL
ncbi:hypothetical protein A0J61_03386 [Choanephora cucurbitarum]|uniref:Sterol regulatory element-binding protein cleavage-activating protein n=1 Tax=Choanephora cucurbitarum TaxID=101091 RepID=A0A1C7NHF8_9FUNG|nr:hypothetical protein A0J61_03386 [Choanephora cucurbitarum]